MIFNAQSKFSFGKFKGRSVFNTWTGSCSGDIRLLLRTYLRELFLTAMGSIRVQDGKSFPCLDMDLVAEALNRVRNTSPHFSILISEDHIIIDKLTSRDKSLVKEIIQNVLNCNFETSNRAFQPYPTISFNEFTTASKGIASLIAEPDYFHYCIQNIADHCFDPELLVDLSKKQSSFLTGFHYAYLRDNIIEYFPNFRTWQYTFPDEILALNERKYRHNVFHNREADNDYDGNAKDDEFAGSYTHDIEGWSDDDINDVLDGDPDAYFNID